MAQQSGLIGCGTSRVKSEMALDKLEKSVTTENNQFRSKHSSGERCGGGYPSGWIATESRGGETSEF